MDKSLTHPKYRADIDGLRAIAVLSVVGFHAFPSAIKGGFIGVDIFFVISGYLISSIIFENLERNSFSFAEFYRRRIRRIFPGLSLVLISCFLFGWFVLLSDEYKQLGKHIAAGAGFISNFVLWNESGYFDNAAATKPLLHLWSLGIEEQFYIIWPFFLWSVWKRRLNVLLIVTVLAVTSFILNVYSIRRNAVADFYLPQTRFWELLIGSILAYLSLFKSAALKKITSKNANIQSLAGLALIAASVLFITKNKAFPGWWALLPVGGATLIISASERAWPNRIVLGNRVMVWFGLISYPLYLWHWPILSFEHIIKNTAPAWHMRSADALLMRTAEIIASILLAWLTYKFIEKPIRTQAKGQYAVASLAFIMFCMLAIGFIAYRGIWKPRNDNPELQKIVMAVGDWDYPNGLKPVYINKIKFFSKRGAKRKTLFWGDSHIEQYAPRIVKLINDDPENTNTAIFATMGGCPPVFNVFEDHHTSCNSAFKEKIMKYALSPDVDSIVVGAAWNTYFIKRKKPRAGEYRYYYLLNGKKMYFDKDGIRYALKSLEDTLVTLAKHKKVFLVIDNPISRSFDPKSFISGSRLTVLHYKAMHFQGYDKEQAKLRGIMIKIAERANAIAIDTPDYFCKDNQCQATLNDGTPIYMDDLHIRPFYAKQFCGFLDATVKKEAKFYSQ